MSVHGFAWSVLYSLLLAILSFSEPVRAQSAEPLDAGPETQGEQPAADARIEPIRALLAGTLEPSVDPQTLFDVSLEDEAAIQIEVLRLRAMLRAIDESEAAPQSSRRAKQSKPAPEVPTPALADVNDAPWRARLQLDRARLDFYALDPTQRKELLLGHASRIQAEALKETEEQRIARESDLEREQALAAAKAARSEAERLVGEELARVIGLEQTVSERRADLRRQRAELAKRRDLVLGWQRRVRDAKADSNAQADAVYDALRQHLRGARDGLSAALDELDSPASESPAFGLPMLPIVDVAALLAVPPDVPTGHVRERRGRLARSIRETAAELAALRADRAAALLDEVTTLNRERLGLLAYLSRTKRAAITGLTLAGLDQARSELRHLLLILRYHRHVAESWLRSIRGGGSMGLSGWGIIFIILPCLVALTAFVWWRRWLPSLLAAAEQRLADSERREGQILPGAARKALRFLAAVHGPLEWLALSSFLFWLLPRTAFALLEVQLMASIIGWSLTSGLVVQVVNALAAGSSATLSSERSGVGQLRLRSLRLVGRVVVVLALVLGISARLVGEGTLYSWVSSLCWLLIVPIAILLVLWWRPSIFERLDRGRKKARVEAWVLRNRTGWQSLFAAVVGAARLLMLGAMKTAKSWLSSFQLARRAHAYLFRRELDRLASDGTNVQVKPLRPDTLAALSPERAAETWIACNADAFAAALGKRALAERGGVVAVVGARGQGKSALLGQLAGAVPGAHIVSCIVHPSPAEIERLTAPGSDQPKAILLDDAQALVKPVIGGLQAFDEVLTLARARSARALWVLAIDSVLWTFLTRARDGRPLFDEVFMLEPWSEEQLGQLLLQRSLKAGMRLAYDDLLEKLPAGADEADRLDALEARRAGYVRMLWDHVRGNPGMALEVWRSSLVEDVDGSARVRPLQLPSSGVLERLPDSALFILRAVLQLAPASAQDVMEATRVSHDQVLNAFRFGEANGYLLMSDGKAQVTWRWLGPVMSLLERRHLLVAP